MSAKTELGSLDISTDILLKWLKCEKTVRSIYDEPYVRSVNEERYIKLLKWSDPQEIPPKQDALRLHIHGANYQCYYGRLFYIVISMFLAQLDMEAVLKSAR